MALSMKLRSLLKLNLRFFLETQFLREGDFIQVASGQQFYDGSDMSLLLPDTSADDIFGNLQDGQVWQSPLKNWVYSSGIPLDGTNVTTPPILASGVYIEGAFRHTTDADFPHKIDYLNGRIIFDNPQPLSLKVHGEFSAHGTRVNFEHSFLQQFNNSFLESKFTTNPGTSMQLVYPSGVNAQPFPAVFIEVDERDFSAYELGNRSAIIKDTVKLHILALDDIQRDNIRDTLEANYRKVLPIIDFNIVPLPLSGIFNTLSPEYIPYQILLRNNKTVSSAGSGNPVRYLTYFDEVRGMNEQPMEEYERATVRFNMSTYLNAPTTPFGNIFGPISTIPTIEGDPF